MRLCTECKVERKAGGKVLWTSVYINKLSSHPLPIGQPNQFSAYVTRLQIVLLNSGWHDGSSLRHELLFVM